MKPKSRSRHLFLVIGLIMLALVLPGAVSARSPIAQFTASTTQGNAPLTVQFTDTSVTSGTTSYNWEFRNDGIITSTSSAKNPSITYTVAGSKTVKLTVTDASGSDSEIKTNYIKVSAPSIAVTSPNGGETWQRGTTKTITWSYTGSPGSTVKIILLKAGTEVGTIKDSTSIGSNGKGSYTWPMSTTGLTGSDFTVSVQSISQPTVKDTSNNYFNITAATTPSPASITVTAPNGGETWQRGTTKTITWSYTGSPGSTVKIILLKADTEVGTIKDSTSIGSSGKGSYTWPMSTTGLTGSDFTVSVQSTSQTTIKDTSNTYFTITSGTSDPVIKTPPAAQFTANTPQGNAPLTVQFTDQSVSAGTTSYQWDTNNDGIVDSTTRNPVSTYQTAGNYTVKLTVTNASGSDSEVKTNYIKVSSPGTTTPPVAQFTANTPQGNAPLTVQFTDQSVSAGTTSYQWDTNNDGIVDSTTRNPVSTYQTAGNYTVKLTVTNASGSDSEVKTNYIKVSSPVILPPDETFGAESNPTGNPIGGGAGYSNIILPGDPKIKYTVTNYAEFAQALTKKYMKGDIIYVPETASIDMTGHPGVEIPANVTIASNRGSAGSPGGRFFWLSSSSDSGWGYATGTMFYITTDNVRITGLRLEGPHMTTDSSVGDNNKQRSAMDLRNGKGLEVDNCEMYGWSYAAVDIETSTGQDALYALGLNSAEIGSAIANIHHNYIHHCQMDGLGYGVVLGGGTALVKANLFDYTRHAVAASGVQGEGYEVSYNIHLGHSTSSVFDVHGQDVGGARIAGDSFKIHHNTVTLTTDVTVGIRGIPIRGVWIDHNKFQWFTSWGVNYSPVLQACGKGNIFMTKNMISSVYYGDLNVYYYQSCI